MLLSIAVAASASQARADQNGIRTGIRTVLLQTPVGTLREVRGL